MSSSSGVHAEPIFRRPSPVDTVDLARKMSEAGERIDVVAVARRLVVSRATMHRWFDTRDHLLAAVLARVADDFIAAANFSSIREMAEDEPELTLQLLLTPDGPVKPQIVAAVRRMLADTRTVDEVGALDATIEFYVDATMALFWSTMVVGNCPNAERVVLIGRALFARGQGQGSGQATGEVP